MFLWRVRWSLSRCHPDGERLQVPSISVCQNTHLSLWFLFLILHTMLSELNSHLSLFPGTHLGRWKSWTLIHLSSLAAKFKGVSFVPHLSQEIRQTWRPPEEKIPFYRGGDSSFGYRSWLKSFNGAQGNSEFELLGKLSESGQKCSRWPDYQCHSQYSMLKTYFPMR